MCQLITGKNSSNINTYILLQLNCGSVSKWPYIEYKTTEKITIKMLIIIWIHLLLHYEVIILITNLKIYQFNTQFDNMSDYEN